MSAMRHAYGNTSFGLLSQDQRADPEVEDALDYGTIGGALLGAGLVFGVWSFAEGRISAPFALIPVLAGGAMILRSRSTAG